MYTEVNVTCTTMSVNQWSQRERTRTYHFCMPDTSVEYSLSLHVAVGISRTVNGLESLHAGAQSS